MNILTAGEKEATGILGEGQAKLIRHSKTERRSNNTTFSLKGELSRRKIVMSAYDEGLIPVRGGEGRRWLCPL
jgi:hypothetical protein